MHFTEKFGDISACYDPEKGSVAFTFQDKEEGSIEEITIEDSNKLLKFLRDCSDLVHKTTPEWGPTSGEHWTPKRG